MICEFSESLLREGFISFRDRPLSFRRSNSTLKIKVPLFKQFSVLDKRGSVPPTPPAQLGWIGPGL